MFICGNVLRDGIVGALSSIPQVYILKQKQWCTAERAELDGAIMELIFCPATIGDIIT